MEELNQPASSKKRMTRTQRRKPAILSFPLMFFTFSDLEKIWDKRKRSVAGSRQKMETYR
jgi:hypothetical protein